MDVITYPCWDQIQTMLVKAAQDIKYPTNRLAIIAKMYHSAEKCCWIDLTYLPLDKIAAILAGENFKCIFWNENHRIPIWISLKFVPSRSPIGNKPALVQVMAWCRTGDKPLPEPMLTQFTNAYMQH